MLEINIKYFFKGNDDKKLKKISIGDWIDLRACNMKSCKTNTSEDESILTLFNNGKTAYIKKGSIIKVGLGVAMELPKGYEAIVSPRSSLQAKFGLMLTNSQGIIDNSYCGDNDEWGAELIAVRDCSINQFDRILQFRVQKNQPSIIFNEVDKLGNKNRGGYGTTGIK